MERLIYSLRRLETHHTRFFSQAFGDFPSTTENIESSELHLKIGILRNVIEEQIFLLQQSSSNISNLIQPQSILPVGALVLFDSHSRWHFADVVQSRANGCLLTSCPMIPLSTKDDEENGSDPKIMVSIRRKYLADRIELLQIPHDDASATKAHVFSTSEIVLALFPTTTCLYRAKVVFAPSKKRRLNEYQVQFDNDEIDGVIPVRNVPPRFVLPFK